MSTISSTAARGLFTKRLGATYKERPSPTSFLRSFFGTFESNTKEVSVEVSRGTEKVAVDVLRGTEGNRNEFSLFSERIYVPPYFSEYFDATEIDLYDQVMGQSQEVGVDTFERFMNSAVEKLGTLQDKIERAYEVQCAQVLQDGIVTMKNGDNIDFKRKALSKPVLAGADLWDAATGKPYVDLETAAKFLRTVAKTEGAVYDVIMGSAAYEAFINNPSVTARADIRRISLDQITTPQMNSVGATLHGTTSAGAYNFRIWSYPQFRDVAGVATPYIDDKLIVVLPPNPRFMLSFGAIPMIMRDTGNAEFPEFVTNVQGQFVTGSAIDSRAKKHYISIDSAGIAIPVAVDQIHTTKVLA